MVEIREDLAKRLLGSKGYFVFNKIILDGPNNRIIVSDGFYNRILIDGDTGILKVSRTGYNVLTTANINLAFHSNYSMFREVQMQCNSEQRFTNSSAYVNYYDCQIQINFADWIDQNMYFECVMKTGVATGYMRLYNITDSSQLVEISTTATSAVSVRSAAINKTALTGVKNFMEGQKIVGAGPDGYTDVYIGRVIMRFDF